MPSLALIYLGINHYPLSNTASSISPISPAEAEIPCLLPRRHATTRRARQFDSFNAPFRITRIYTCRCIIQVIYMPCLNDISVISVNGATIASPVIRCNYTCIRHLDNAWRVDKTRIPTTLFLAH